MKKILVLLMLAAFTMPLAGCETMQRKFTRKPKKPAHTASQIYFDEGDYVKKYSNAYYYKTHYTLWKSWNDELMDNVSGNDKKVGRAASEALGHLRSMQNYLKPAKAAEMEVVISDMDDLSKKLEATGRVQQSGPLKTELERIRRAVASNFYYDKVKEELLADKVDLGGDEPEPGAEPEEKTPAAA